MAVVVNTVMVHMHRAMMHHRSVVTATSVVHMVQVQRKMFAARHAHHNDY